VYPTIICHRISVPFIPTSNYRSNSNSKIMRGNLQPRPIGGHGLGRSEHGDDQDRMEQDKPALSGTVTGCPGGEI